MDTKWKNTTKIITLVVSGLIISCYLAVVGCLWQENMLTSAWKGTAYYKTPYHMQEIETAFRRVVQFEDDTNVRMREKDLEKRDQKLKANFSFYYSISYKVLENRQAYQGENSKMEAAFSKIRELDMNGNFISDDDISDLQTNDTITYNLMTLPDVSTYMIAKQYKTYTCGKNVQKKFDGEKMDFGTIRKPDNCFIIIAFQNKYLEKRDAMWQRMSMEFFVMTGVAMLAVIAFLYSAVTLGIRNCKRRWYWWDAKMLIAVCTGMVYQVQFSQQSSNSITGALLAGNTNPLVWKLACFSLIGILFLGVLGLAVISLIGQWSQKTLYRDGACRIVWNGLKKLWRLSEKAFAVLKKLWAWLIQCILGQNKYPEGINRAQKRLARLTATFTGFITVCYLIFIGYVLYIYSYVPVGYHKETLHNWYPKKLIFPGEFISKPENVICVSVIASVLYLLLFLLYIYCNKKIFTSFTTLEKEIKKLHEGDFAIDAAQAQNTPAYGDLLLLSEVGAGFEETLQEKIKSERMKVALVTNVSHDLKTPLTSVISYIDLLKRENDLPQKAKEYVEILDKKAGNLKRIVQDVFELAKTTSGEITIEKKNLDINRLVVQTLSDMEDKIQRYGMDVRFLPQQQDVMICSDGNRLYRVMQNLIDNALKYALEGTRIYIRENIYLKSGTERTDIQSGLYGSAIKADSKKTMQEQKNPQKNVTEQQDPQKEVPEQKEDGSSKAKQVVVLSITNIAKYEIDFTAEEAMERFFRGDKSRQTEGSGLGLAIAKAFTEACGGTLTIDIDGDQFRVNLSFPCI